jgi:DNA end-binding protein Ku
MKPRAIGSGTITFGLVSIPIKIYVATHSEQLSFNLLHAKCGTRIRQQFHCPHCKRVVERSETVRGYQVRKDRYVSFTDKELRTLEAEANRAIEIAEFVPLETVDPLYFEDAHYLGPGEGAGKAYRLLAEAMHDTERVALAQWVHHGKEHLVLIRARNGGLVLHGMYYADEVRAFGDIGAGGAKPQASETQMARRLIEQLSAPRFRPEKYEDKYRDRLKVVVKKKVAGEEITAAEPEKAPAKVIDLMDALKASLGGRGTKRRPAARERMGARRLRIQGRRARA